MAIPMAADTPPPVREAAALGETYVQVGYMNMEISFWNPLTIQMVEDYVACYLMYSALWTYDEDWAGPVSDLALEWDSEPQANGSMNTYVRITDNAYFRNMGNLADTSQKLTAYDVSWTFNLIMNNTGYTFDWYLRDIYEIEVLSDTELIIKTTFVKATLIDDLSGVPILCEDYWGDLSQPMAKSMAPEAQYGTGPFVYEDHEEASWYAFKKAPNYFGEIEYGGDRTIDIDGIMYRIYTDPSGIALALNSGDVDAVNLGGEVTTYMEVLGVGTSLDIDKFAVSEPGICDVAINGIPDFFDTNTYYNGNPILRDPFVRQAIMMTLDKTYIVGTILNGLATPAASVVQPGAWQADIDEYAFDPAAARQILIDHGYSADDDGDTLLEATSSSMAVQEGWCDEGDELSGFRCEAPDTDQNYYTIALNWVNDAYEAGVGLVAAQKSEGVMTSKAWYLSDYDIWVWHWGWGPEPIGAALTCWLTEEIRDGGYNCQGPMGPWWVHGESADYEENYSTSPFVDAAMIEEFGMDEEGFIGFSAFDQNISIAQQTLDVTERKVILDKLQQWVYDSYTENPPYYDLGLYGVSTAHFVGWGDWEEHNGRPMTSDLLWTWFDLMNADNLAPEFTSDLDTDYQALINQDFYVTVQVKDRDGDPITVNCTWGDGSLPEQMLLTGDTTIAESVTFTHQYTTVASDLELMISAWDGLQNHEASTSALVDVVTILDYGPVIVPGSLVGTPASPVYIEQAVDWTISASDAETDETGALKFTWVWDDGTYDVSEQIPAELGGTVTDTQTHTWTDIGTKVVEVWVFDGYQDDETSSEHNITATKTYTVLENTAPYSLSASEILWTPDTWATVSGSAIDNDPDTLTFTWEWDDGTFNVTSVLNEDPGSTLANSVKHMWDADGTYDVTLWVDDGNDHNESVSGTVTISSNPGPTALAVVQEPNPGWVDQEITFTASASDANGDPLTMTLEFGDGTLAVDTTEGGSTEAQTVVFTHTYTAEGPFSATLYADDSTTNSSLPFSARVSENAAPDVSMQSSFVAGFNVTFEIAPIEVSDDDGDVVTIWYDWGDETPMTMGDPEDYYSATHVYMDIGTFTVKVYADDGMGHNDSISVPVMVSETNLKPTLADLTLTPEADTYFVGDVITFTVKVSDQEGDNVTVVIDFDDDTTDQMVVDTLPGNVNATVNFTHAFETIGDYSVVASVTDGEDHSDMTPQSRTTDVDIVGQPVDTNWILIGGILLLIVAVIVAAFLLMKRKKGAEPAAGEDGMEGMAAPVDQSPPPPLN